MNNTRSLIKFIEPFFTDSFYKYQSIRAFNEENDFIIEFDVPGYSKENIKVLVDDNILKIRGELKTNRKTDSFIKEYSLNNKFDKENISAEVKDGILTIKIPYRKNKEKLIEIL